MDDKSLAIRIVALGVGQFIPMKNEHGITTRSYDTYAIDGEYFRSPAPDSVFVRDWRVAGALMEKVDAHFIERLSPKTWAVRSDKPYGEGKTREWYENESLPRAICEACVEALS